MCSQESVYSCFGHGRPRTHFFPYRSAKIDGICRQQLNHHEFSLRTSLLMQTNEVPQCSSEAYLVH